MDKKDINIAEKVTDAKSNLSRLPQIDRWLGSDLPEGIREKYSRKTIIDCMRSLLDKKRTAAIAGSEEVDSSMESLNEELIKMLTENEKNSLKRVINATGIIIHTNLGRSPIMEDAAHNIFDIATSYNNLEFDLDTGQRGSRTEHVHKLLKDVAGTEDVYVVNNNAAAVLLVLDTLTHNKDVIISRGQLIEIGGSFRIPDVMSKSGSIMREVGTTNRTRISDYEKAITADTGLLMLAHPSNYKIVGFTDSVKISEIAELGMKYDIPTYYDAGSGLLSKDLPFGDEPYIADIFKSNIDLVSFSGDKLAGFSQAGIIAGKKKYIDKIRNNPLSRAMRVDKMILAVMESTLKCYQAGEHMKKIPVMKMFAQSMEELEKKASDLKVRINTHLRESDSIYICPQDSYTGGGALPGLPIPSWSVVVDLYGLPAHILQEKLRKSVIPVISRIDAGKVVLDVRTLFDKDIEEIAGVFAVIMEEINV